MPLAARENYIGHCLSAGFNKSGFVLQDLVNELGRRLDYEVTNGRYQGTSNAVGFDGLWHSPDGQTIIVEVKTTDAYRVSLDTIIGYRDKLQDSPGDVSFLIVVGRQETGELEAQVRGSRHAWDVRLISAEALVKLVKLKENADDPETGRKIRSVMVPVEYTRLDSLVDVMFATATDIESADVEPPGPSEAKKGVWEFTGSQQLQAKREQLVDAMSAKIGGDLIKKSRTLYWSSDHTKRIACTLSKRYTAKGTLPYWYGYHPRWDEFIRDADNGYFVIGCMDLDYGFAIPSATMNSLKEHLSFTKNEKEMYWHIQVSEPSPGTFEMLVPKRSANLPLAEFKLELSPKTQRNNPASATTATPPSR